MLSISLAMPIFISKDYNLCFSPIAYNTFLEIFKLPLAIFATVVPYNAFYISYLRSEQSRKQIELLISNNIFSNHYKHIEEFNKHLKQSCEQIDNISYLYRLFFPKSA